jgi:hypothetical protein
MPIRTIVSVGIVIVLAMTASHARADWTAYGDFTACPRQYIPQTSGSEGGFATESACNARVNQVQRESPTSCARFTCKDNAVGGATSNTDPVAQAITAGIRTMTPQQALGTGLGILGVVAIVQGLNSQQQTSDQAAAEAREAAIRRQQEQQLQEQRAEATKQELLHSLKGTGASTDLALKDTGAGAGLQLKTGDSSPPPKAVIHDGFSLPMGEPYQ